MADCNIPVKTREASNKAFFSMTSNIEISSLGSAFQPPVRPYPMHLAYYEPISAVTEELTRMVRVVHSIDGLVFLLNEN